MNGENMKTSQILSVLVLSAILSGCGSGVPTTDQTLITQTEIPKSPLPGGTYTGDCSYNNWVYDGTSGQTAQRTVTGIAIEWFGPNGYYMIQNIELVPTDKISSYIGSNPATQTLTSISVTDNTITYVWFEKPLE